METQLESGDWVPARPINWRYERWWERLAWAWGVFRGRYDAVVWPGGQ